MIRTTTMLSNDQVDKHNEKMSLSALKSARDQTNANIISSYKEHDYRFPPIGRFINANIKNENGINVLYGEIELFETKDMNKKNPIENKKLRIHDHKESSITYDKSYELNQLIKDVEKLQQTISNKKPLFEIKKSLEPVSTLTIIIGTILTKSFLEGFFNKAGSDFLDALKNIIVKHSRKNKLEKIYI